MQKFNDVRGVRNHNPLNLRKGQDWDGEHKRGNELDADFEVFTHPVYGIRAAARTLKTYRNKHKRDTIRLILERFAPEDDNNDTEAYIDDVCHRTGIHPDRRLNGVEYVSLISAMIHHENGQQPYSRALIAEGVERGFS